MATAANTLDFVSAQIDRLGDIKAQIADLKKVEAELAAAIIQSVSDAHDGRFYRATVVHTAESFSLDPKAAEAKLRDLGVDGRWFSKNQKSRKASVSVRVTARRTA